LIVALPVVAIVGRPNVGKSSLFNSLARRRISIVAPTPGVTRDRLSTVCELLNGQYVELVDTGGFGVVDRDDLSLHVQRQIQYAVNSAGLILFVVDAREGLNPLDRDTARMLMREFQRVRLVANKVDEPHMTTNVGEFMKLGLGEPICISAMTGHGRAELEELIADFIRTDEAQTPQQAVMKVAVVGRRNTGKSTFVNSLVHEERVIVSEIPGTTRDSVDVVVEKDGRSLVVVDTAGVRKKSKIVTDVEFYGYTRVLRSIEAADVVLFFIDASVAIGQVDKKLGHLIVEAQKPCVLVINKWDLAKGEVSTQEYGEYLEKVFPVLDYPPVAFTTAKNGRNVFSTLDVASSLFKQARIRVGTGVLNRILRQALEQNAPKPKRGTRTPKLLYATQVATAPPTIVLFVDRPANVTAQYERFIVNRLRQYLPFEEVPIRLLVRARTGRLSA